MPITQPPESAQSEDTMGIINDLLSVIDRLLKLKRLRQQTAKNLFADIIAPIFDDLATIQEDYLGILSTTAASLRQPGKTVKEVAKQLRQDRLRFEPVRIKTRAVSEQLKHLDHYPQIQEFVHCVIVYLPRGELFGENPSAATGIIDALDHWDPSDEFVLYGMPVDPRARLTELVDTTITWQRKTWNDLCESFGRLKVAVTTSVA